MQLNINEQTALNFVLEFISVKELLTSAMHHFSEENNVQAKDNADTCFKAITAFLTK